MMGVGSSCLTLFLPRGAVLIEPEGTCSLGGSESSCKTALTDASRVLPESRA
jgi:hypothetical protein